MSCPAPVALDAERQDLVEQFIGLARAEARRFAARWSIDADESLSTALAALVQAGATFVPDRGAFASYARAKIRGWLRNALAARARADRAGRAADAPHVFPLVEGSSAAELVDRRAPRPDARLIALEDWDAAAGKFSRAARP